MDDLGELLLAHAGNGNSTTIRDLIARGANVHYPDEETGDRALHRAAMDGHVDAGRTLIELGADVNAANTLGQRPLHWAADGGHMDMIRLLIEKGAQVNAEDCDGKTAADWAASEGRTDAETLLLKLGAIKKRGTERHR